MSDPSLRPPNFRADAFRGLADDYVSYRTPYPRALLDEMLDRAALPIEARLLDLACGPGRLTLAIAPRFAEVWAVDLEPEMIAAAKAGAGALGWPTSAGPSAGSRTWMRRRRTSTSSPAPRR